MREKIYILHKSGADSHYQALSYLLEQHNSIVVYREFSVFSAFFKSVIKLNKAKFIKQLVNFVFIISLLFTKNKKVVLGIAPVDPKLKFILFFLKKHKVYYHTSWANWSGGFYPKSKKITPKQLSVWKYFLEEVVLEIFAVTTTAKEEILANYKIAETNIHVVNHSFDASVFEYKKHLAKENSFICVGRLRPDKGVEEILTYFSKHPTKQLTIVGKGVLEPLVKKYAHKYENIQFEGFVKNKIKLVELYNQHNYMLLNSQKTKKWEELFGMVIIEGMACGLVPIATNHAGPKEIVKKEIGVLYKEKKLEETLNNLPPITSFKKELAVVQSEEYSVEKVAEKWKAILK